VKRPNGGILLSAAHSFMPNRLGYCGPDHNDLLFEACIQGRADERLIPVLREFQGAYPYLRLIAQCNGISDPFDYRVTEAYWIGNELLDGVTAEHLFRHLSDRLRRKLTVPRLKRMFREAGFSLFPHHALHVLHGFSSREHGPEPLAYPMAGDPATIKLMDQCRVSWGQVRALDGDFATVERRQLQYQEDGQLVLGPPRRMRVQWRIDGRGFVPGLQLGQFVSMHWNWICSRLGPAQVRQAEHYTRRGLQLLTALQLRAQR
jgi:hypothetical protein